MSSTRELMKMKERLRRYLSDHLLGLNDSPHRIALGVGLGVFIAFTPTFGLQILLYLAIASAIGANKISGIGPLFINNPFTLLPLVYGRGALGPSSWAHRARRFRRSLGRAISRSPLGA